MIIAIDFDGTCVKHNYPDIGPDIGAPKWLRRWVEAGAQLILYTMRDGKELGDAIRWFERNNIELWGANYSPKTWSSSPKIYANLYIDDAAYGMSLVSGTLLERPWVNWDIVGRGVLGMVNDHVKWKASKKT